jgi:hypothetical protein
MKTGAMLLVSALTLAAPAANATGLWPLSYTQRHDANGKPFPGAKAYFYDASTGDPIAVHREYSLATPHANPVEADGNGVFPGVFVDGSEAFYRFRVTTAAGVVLSDDAVIPNIGPAEGEGGEPVEPVETSALAKTGDVKARYGTGTHVGWLPCNGLTMGSATSGANFAGDDNQVLFLYLWGNDANLVVVGGRGTTAAADWAANKRLTLPDMRGRVIAGLDTMGNGAANILPNVDILGEITGVASAALLVSEMPQLSLQDGVTSSDGLHGHPYRLNADPAGTTGTSGGFHVGVNSQSTEAPFTGAPSATNGQQIGGGGAHTHTVAGTVGSALPAAVHRIQPSMALTFYIKL